MTFKQFARTAFTCSSQITIHLCLWFNFQGETTM